MLRGIPAQRDLSTAVLGTAMAAPVLLAPVGVLSIVHADAERAVARAAAALGLAMVVSTASSTSMEDLQTELAGSPAWYQLYWPKDRDVAASLVARAQAGGYTALVVTLDTWQLGWRPRDLSAAYLPFLRGEGIANYVSDPAFRAGLVATPEADPNAAVLHFLAMFNNAALTWDDLGWLQSQTTLPIVLKGLLDALPGIVAAAGELPVLFDSGVRTGSDAVKALALGAAAVLLGRPWVYGLALDGQVGVEHVLKAFLADLDLQLGLSGHGGVGELSPSSLLAH